MKGWVVSAYSCVISARNQLTGSGVTVVGEAEKLPVATSCTWLPFATALTVMD
jgi:hypothetical protein